MSKKTRGWIAVTALLATFILLFAAGGYFVNVDGVGTGWPGFFATGGIALGVVVVFGALAGAAIGLSEWVDRGK